MGQPARLAGRLSSWNLAAIASIGNEPHATAQRLLQSFEDVLHLVRKTHSWVARTIALSACRSANPLSLARSYMQNYDMIVRAVSVTDARNARRVACQVFRSDDPLRWPEWEQTAAYAGLFAAMTMAIRGH